MAFPWILFVIPVVVALGTTALTIVLTVGVVYFPRFARLVRGTVLVLKDQEFVLASRCCGANDLRIATRHVLPNAMTPILVLVTLAMGIAIPDRGRLELSGSGHPAANRDLGDDAPARAELSGAGALVRRRARRVHFSPGARLEHGGR